jgi:HK97 family phage major capsid protein
MNPSMRGLTAIRTLKALAIANGSSTGATAYAQSQGWGNVHDVLASIKATVTQVGTDDMALASPAAFDFAEFVRPLSILGKITGFRRVPARVRMIHATAGSSAYWAGERNPRPISRMTFVGDTLEALSVIGILVATKELMRSSAPSAESILSRDLAAAAVYALDLALIDPENAGVTDVKPASVTSGVTALHSAGATLANIDADLALLIQALSDAGSDLSMATFVMRPKTALYLARLRSASGDLAYPGMGAKGGVLLGLPAITSAAVPVSTGSPGSGNSSITLLDPAQITVADDNNGAIDVSENTALQMESTPAGGPTAVVSMFQTESVALKITRYANWQAVRPGMAQVLDGVTY